MLVDWCVGWLVYVLGSQVCFLCGVFAGWCVIVMVGWCVSWVVCWLVLGFVGVLVGWLVEVFAPPLPERQKVMRR